MWSSPRSACFEAGSLKRQARAAGRDHRHHRRSRPRCARTRGRARRTLRAAGAPRPADPGPGAAARKRRPVARRSGAVREWIQAYGGSATLSTLHALVDPDARTRARRILVAPAVRMAARRAASAHQALARRREPRGALRPPGNVRGRDARRSRSRSCPRPRPSATPAASSRWRAPGRPRRKDLNWRHQLESTAATITRRARLSGRSAVVKKLRANWPGFV